MLFRSTLLSAPPSRLFGARSASAALALAMGLGALLASTAQAAETTTFAYDALGRLAATAVSGGPATGGSTAITHDAAGNRTRYQSAGLQPAPPLTSLIVLPINGLTVLPLPSAGDPF